MKSKKHTIFLILSLAVFIASVIAVIVYFCEAKAELDAILAENTDTQFRVGSEMSLFWSMFFTVGVLCTELSFIRSVYKLLKHHPNKRIAFCYLLSALVAVLSIAFYGLLALNLFDLVSDTGRSYVGDVYLLTFWPAFIVSFVLGSLPIKQRDGCNIKRI
jgi:uncharacterized protein with PQ loop repeat